ncbi:toll/interleukin-1 receptor domain-containing protein [Streptomyces flaveolus]|uniref:toll/interleukin-1 receptor domain-containing protein n=1 Tax=Streptomyces flaveolus TaxID=67297 RepID=UPI00343A4AD2
MRYFVSYARRDNSVERLREVRALLSETGHVYVDDLEAHSVDTDRVQTVVNALMRADVFVAIQSDSYLTTEWTRWEFDSALHIGIEMLAVLPSNDVVRPAEAGWPWSGSLPPVTATAIS